MALIAEINSESVSEAIHGPETTIVFTTATWKKKSKQLLSDVMSASFDANVRIVAIPVDEDGMDELALSLGLHDIPTVRIYGAGGRLISSLSPENASIDSIHAIFSCLSSPSWPRLILSMSPSSGKGSLRDRADSALGDAWLS